MTIQTITPIVVLSLFCLQGCQANSTSVASSQYTILTSGAPEELHVQPKGAPYALVISPSGKGHQVIILPKGDDDLQRFRSQKITFWVEGNEVEVEVLEQSVIDVGVD